MTGQHHDDPRGVAKSLKIQRWTKPWSAFMEQMTSFKRQESKDPFCDPNNSNVSFLSTIYHTLQKAPAERQMEIHMGIFNYGVGCIRAVESGMPVWIPSEVHTVNIPMSPHFFLPSHIYRPMHRPLCVYTAQCTQRLSYAFSPAHSSQGTYPQSVNTSSNSADASQANSQTSSGSSSQNSTSYSPSPSSLSGFVTWF